VLQEDKCVIDADGEEICSCNSLPMALGLYAMCFYVFNLAFPRYSVKTLLFLQKFSFRINDPCQDSQVLRMYRAGAVVMENLSKWKPTGSSRLQKAPCSKTSSNIRTKAMNRAKTRNKLAGNSDITAATATTSDAGCMMADFSLSCARDRPTCSNDLIAKTATVPSADHGLVADTMRSKRARKIPGRLCE